jgi:hypothetical protein
MTESIKIPPAIHHFIPIITKFKLNSSITIKYADLLCVFISTA